MIRFMKVKSIVPITKKRYQVVTEEQLAFVLYKGELSRYRIWEGGELTEDAYREIVDGVLKKRAKLRAMHLLTAQNRTEAQLREKLMKDGYPREVVDCALDYVKSYHYVDDERYADSYMQSMLGKKSRKIIFLELERRGVSAEIIERVMEQTEDMPEEEMIDALVRKRAGEPHKMDDKEFRRVYGYLMRRGYQSGEILDVLRKYQEN